MFDLSRKLTTLQPWRGCGTPREGEDTFELKFKYSAKGIGSLLLEALGSDSGLVDCPMKKTLYIEVSQGLWNLVRSRPTPQEATEKSVEISRLFARADLCYNSTG